MGGAMVKSFKRSSIISTLSSNIYPWSTGDDGGDEALLDEQLGMQEEQPPSPPNPEIQRLISEFLEAETSDKMEFESIVENTAKAIHAEMKEILNTQLLISQLKREIVVEEWSNERQNLESTFQLFNHQRNLYNALLTTAQVEEETRELETLAREEKELHEIIVEYKNDIKGVLMRQRMIQMKIESRSKSKQERILEDEELARLEAEERFAEAGMRHELTLAEATKLKKLRLKKSEWIKNAEAREQETKDYRDKLARFEGELHSTRSRLENAKKEEEHMILKMRDQREKLRQSQENLKEINMLILREVGENSPDHNPQDQRSPSQMNSHRKEEIRTHDGFLVIIYTPNAFPSSEADEKLFSVSCSLPDINLQGLDDYRVMIDKYPYPKCRREASCWFDVELAGEYVFCLSTRARALLLVDDTFVLETESIGEAQGEETISGRVRGFFCEFFYVGCQIEPPLKEFLVTATCNWSDIISDINLPSARDFLDCDPHCPLEYMVVRCSGWLHIRHPGTYLFSLESEDGSYLIVDDELVVDNGGAHGFCSARNSKFLQRGEKRVEVQFFINEGNPGLVVTMNGPDTGGEERLLSGYCTDQTGRLKGGGLRSRQVHQGTGLEQGSARARGDIEVAENGSEVSDSTSCKSVGVVCLRKGRHQLELTWEEEEAICLRYKGPDTLQVEKMVGGYHQPSALTDTLSIWTSPTKESDKLEFSEWQERSQSL
ncbi:hypothetical protein GUITHDRAFT_139041 [Guillardia theta CCMP2712]|uniref:PA14 domain-containing protein n=1 Tax=Guillardia theta (strain CCMP2712) TaxID=905079 RepID=L1JAZ1_GUITC|nr:hypothetical protein GUITHDRAFT_139041 [Guillardia theta CCMP2712]EKX45482.1 hypothetical protein GUITHDRAFT_139041 [Guillardia theta CCMP2712]|eukprot:XP_005832462.1 hypothetical protein GUITHDRAFT_139041 [Guillardia theta CCMP2712]